MDPMMMMKVAQMLGKKKETEWQPIGAQSSNLGGEQDNYEDESMYYDPPTQGDQAANDQRIQSGIDLVLQMQGSGGILNELADPSFMQKQDKAKNNPLGTTAINVA